MGSQYTTFKPLETGPRPFLAELAIGRNGTGFGSETDPIDSTDLKRPFRSVFGRDL